MHQDAFEKKIHAAPLGTFCTTLTLNKEHDASYWARLKSGGMVFAERSHQVGAGENFAIGDVIRASWRPAS
jgi:hypothetical protein